MAATDSSRSGYGNESRQIRMFAQISDGAQLRDLLLVIEVGQREQQCEEEPSPSRHSMNWSYCF
jgi:hypothetical protein